MHFGENKSEKVVNFQATHLLFIFNIYIMPYRTTEEDIQIIEDMLTKQEQEILKKEEEILAKEDSILAKEDKILAKEEQIHWITIILVILEVIVILQNVYLIFIAHQ